MKNDIKYIIRILLNVFIIGLIIYIVANLFIFLLPVIVVLIVIYYLYRIFIQIKMKNKTNSDNIKKNNNRIKNNIEEAEIVAEKFDK